MCLNSCAAYTKRHFVLIVASVISVLLATRQIVIFGEHRDQIMCGYDAVFESNTCECNDSDLIHSKEQFICMSHEEKYIAVTDCKSNGNQIQFYDICLKEPPKNSWKSPNKHIWICRAFHIRRQVPTIHCSRCVSDQSPYQFYDECLMEKPKNSIWSRDSARYECNGLFMPDLESNTCPMERCIEAAIKFYDVCLSDEPLHSEFDLSTSSFVCIEEYTRVGGLCVSKLQRKGELEIFDELITRTYKDVLMIVGSCVALLLVLYCCCKFCNHCCRKCCNKGEQGSLMKSIDYNASSMRPKIENQLNRSSIMARNDLTNMTFKTVPFYDYSLPKNPKQSDLSKRKKDLVQKSKRSENKFKDQLTIGGTLEVNNVREDANIESNISLMKLKRMKSTGNLSDNGNTNLNESFKEDIEMIPTENTEDDAKMEPNKSLMEDTKSKANQNDEANASMKLNKSFMEHLKSKANQNNEANASMKSNISLMEDIKSKVNRNTEGNASMKSNKSLMEHIKSKANKNTEGNASMKSNKSLMEHIKSKAINNTGDNASIKSNKSLMEHIKSKATKNTGDNASIKSNKSLMEHLKMKAINNTISRNDEDSESILSSISRISKKGEKLSIEEIQKKSNRLLTDDKKSNRDSQSIHINKESLNNYRQKEGEKGKEAPTKPKLPFLGEIKKNSK